MIRKTFIAIGIFIGGALFAQSDISPNIILINVDDFGWADVGYNNNQFYETPNIDLLAAQGMSFTNAYASASNCAPSRACLMTGAYTPRHGIYTVGNSDRGKSYQRKLIPTPNTLILSDNFTTIAEELKQIGYVTASIGKWHLGDDPLTQGFDLNIAGNHKGHPKSYFSPYKNKNLADGCDGEHLTDRLTKEAIKFIKNHSDTNFFLYLPYYAVHTPLQGKQELISKYEQKPDPTEKRNPVFAAMVETVDHNIGELLTALKKLNVRENTIIIFTADNGAMNVISDQEPLRAGKGSYYEGGIREPLIISWPNVIEAGSKSHIPVSNIDFYPTILEMVGVEEPLSQIIDGQSILPILSGESIGEINRPLFWHFPIYLQAYKGKDFESRDPLFRTRPGSVIRLGEWKLHEYFEDSGLELYNLKSDIGEKENLADEYPEKTKELHDLLIQWRNNINAPIPTELNPKYNPELN